MNRSKRLLIVLLILTLALVACSGDDDKVELKAVGGSDDEATQQASAAIAQNFDGLLVFVKGTGLYAYNPNSDQGPVFITDVIDLSTINVAPSGDMLVYETGDFDDGHAYLLDARTLQTHEISTTFSTRGAETWGVLSWSPDEQWAITFLWPLGIEAVRLDGTASYELSDTNDTFSTWLNDGSVLLIDQDFANFQGGNVVYRGAAHFDVTTGQREDWDVDLDALAQDFFGTVEALLAAHDLAMPAGEEFDQPGGININPPENFFSFQTAAALCESWTFTSSDPVPAGEEPEVIYESPQTYKITDFQTLDDGSWLYLKWSLPNCRISALPVVSLLHQTPGQEPQIITENIFSEIDYSRTRLNLGTSGRIVLAADQTRVLWVGGNAEAGESTLNLTDLATGDTQILLTEQRGDLSPDAFAANQMFRAAYWLTP